MPSIYELFPPLDGFTLFPAGMAAALTAYNLAGAWPRDARTRRPTGRVSVLIPARDEIANIEPCVRAALRALPDDGELIVYDDQSTDGTSEALAALAIDPRLRVLRGEGLPDGWVGKPHACHQLGRAATGDTLVFLDADVRLAADGLHRVEALLHDHDAQVLTVFPRQRFAGWLQAITLPFLPLSFVAWIPLDGVHRSPRPWLLAVSGQLMAFRRDAYEALGGYASIRAEVVDDMAICRRAKVLGQRVVFARGDRTATCQMYATNADMWAGFSKNLYEGLGARPAALLAVVTLYLAAFVLPYARLGWAWASGAAAPWTAVAGTTLNLGLRAALAGALGHSAVSVLLHPLGALVVVGVALNSARWHHGGRVAWRGRTYAPRDQREGSA